MNMAWHIYGSQGKHCGVGSLYHYIGSGDQTQIVMWSKGMTTGNVLVCQSKDCISE